MGHPDYCKIFKNIKEHPPLVHCITNYVTINDVANIILAAGGSPVMAEEKEEVEEITQMCDGLVLNIGTLQRKKTEAMLLAGKKANETGCPVIFDPVGAGSSRLRTETARLIMQEIDLSVIRGNVSEIKALCQGKAMTKGVDADGKDALTKDSMKDMISIGRKLSEKTGAVILITGAVDLAVCGRQAAAIRNGDPNMARITGSGCMLDGVLGVFAGANPACLFDAIITAAGAMGICGEKAAASSQGTGSFRMHLMDEMSKITAQQVERGIKIEHKSERYDAVCGNGCGLDR